MYVNGQGVKRDLDKAAELFTKACDSNNAVACSNLGLMYASGEGAPKNYYKAVELFTRHVMGGICWDAIILD